MIASLNMIYKSLRGATLADSARISFYLIIHVRLQSNIHTA